MAFLLAAFAVTGCATVQVSPASIATEKIGQLPPLGSQAAAPVGGVVFSQFRYWSRTGYRLEDPVALPFALGRVAVAQGEGLVRATVDGKAVLCTERRTYYDPITGPHRTSCFIESAIPGTSTRITVAPGVVWMEKDLPQPARYSVAEQFLPRPDAFKYELLYQGISGKTIRLSYREFLNDLARPAYFQDVSYDITSMPTFLTFKTVRLEILGADNNALTYRVLSGF